MNETKKSKIKEGLLLLFAGILTTSLAIYREYIISDFWGAGIIFAIIAIIGIAILLAGALCFVDLTLLTNKCNSCDGCKYPENKKE
jgi:hypothetical protein